MRTHPPLLYAFPPKPVSAKRDDNEERTSLDSDDDTDSDDARDAILPRPRARSTKSKESQKSPTRSSHDEGNLEIPDDNRWLSMHGLIRHTSPYIILDDSRLSAFSPSMKAIFATDPQDRNLISSVKARDPTSPTLEQQTPTATISDFRKAAIAASRQKSRLPNTNLNIDLRTLNLHLALRTAEILACSESMWEWVREIQVEHQRKRDLAAYAARRTRSGSIEVIQPQRSRSSGVSFGTSDSSEWFKNTILDLGRDDFDNLLCRFDL